MSIEAMNWAINQTVKTPSQKLILVLLANRAHPQNGECWPGVQSIADQACLSTRHAKRVIGQLCELGLITRTARSGGHFGRSTNLYQLQLGVNLQSDNMSPCKISKGTSATSKGTPASAQGDMGVPLNQRETKEKPKRAARTAPRSFKITPKLREWAAKEVPGVNLVSETAKFLDHEYATPKKNWEAAWRNWMRKAPDFAPKKNGSATSSITQLAKQKGLEARPGESWEQFERRVQQTRGAV